MKPKTTKNPQINVSFPPELYNRLVRWCEGQRFKISHPVVIRGMVEAFLDDEEKKEQK